MGGDSDHIGEGQMAYSDFTIADLEHRCGLTILEPIDLFSGVGEIDMPAALQATLSRYLPLAVKLSSEKGRSELLIAPMVFELKLQYSERISVFSGIEFSVEPSAGLNGRCDFIVSRHPLQLAIRAPVCMLMEAKKEDIVGGIPQCLAEMVAAQRFNRSEGIPEGPIFGAVTTGLAWLFMRLDGTTASVDSVEYSIQSPRSIFSILTAMALGQIPPA